MTEDSNSRVFDLILGRVFKIVYLGLNEKDKKVMEKVFLSGDEKEKDKFVKKYIPDFKTIFSKEAKNIEKEIELEIEKQL